MHATVQFERIPSPNHCRTTRLQPEGLVSFGSIFSWFAQGCFFCHLNVPEVQKDSGPVQKDNLNKHNLLRISNKSSY